MASVPGSFQRVACAIAASLAAGPAHSEAPPLQSLLDLGYVVSAEGRLVQEPGSTCLGLPDRYDKADMKSGYNNLVLYGCFESQPVFGRFKRVEGKNGAFVCVSFRDWTCYRSETTP